MTKLKSNLMLFGMFAASCILVDAIYAKITFSRTNSLPYNWFFISSGEVRPRDYIMFDVDTPVIKDTLVKKQICHSGDVLQTSRNEVRCNSKVIAKRPPMDEIPFFQFNGVIPEGKAFVMGTNLYSYDSRYFGLVDLNEATKVIPLAAWWKMP